MPFWPGHLVKSTSYLNRVYVDSPPTITDVNGWAPGPSIYSRVNSAVENEWSANFDQTCGGYCPFSVALNLGNTMGNGGATAAVKGRLNFYNLSGNAPGGGMSVITLWDSNPFKTFATVNHRPIMDAADTFIGIDNPTQGFANNAVQLAVGASTSISNYINSLPDNTRWLERLTSTLKTFAVPLNIGSNYIDAVESAAPANPAANTNRLYADSTSHALKCLTSSGGSCFPSGDHDGNILAAGNIGFNTGKGQHFVTQAANNDHAGTCTAASATICTVTFTTAYTFAPVCTATDQTAATAVQVTPSTSSLIITTANSTSDVFAYICVGNPN
jgi:hypothetical protein